MKTFIQTVSVIIVVLLIAGSIYLFTSNEIPYEENTVAPVQEIALQDLGWSHYIFQDDLYSEVKVSESIALRITNKEGYTLGLGGDFMDMLRLQHWRYDSGVFSASSKVELQVDQNAPHIFSNTQNGVTTPQSIFRPSCAFKNELGRGQTLHVRFTLIDQGEKATTFNIRSGKEHLLLRCDLF